jgi:hypothetical protein
LTARKPKKSKEVAKTGEIIPPGQKTHFTPFVKGHQINVKQNMPRGRFITAQLIRLMQEEIEDPEFDPKDKTKVKARAKAVYFFCRKLLTMALQGDPVCLKMVMDRIEGTAISTMIFKPTDDPENFSAVQTSALGLTREKLAGMPYEEQLALYNSTLNDSHGTSASA